MAKKNQNEGDDSSGAVQETAPKPAAPSPVKQPVTVKPQSLQPQRRPEQEPVVTAPTREPTMTLQDAARRFVIGYKDHWWPGIKNHAETHGFVSLEGTESACRAELARWGAKLRN